MPQRPTPAPSTLATCHAWRLRSGHVERRSVGDLGRWIGTSKLAALVVAALVAVVGVADQTRASGPVVASTPISTNGAQTAPARPAFIDLLPDFEREVERLVENAGLGEAVVGVSVVDSATGTALASFRADEPHIPASNMKLLTSGAALHVLGPDFRFRTRLVQDGDRLIVIGDGDPCFGDPKLLEDTRIGRDIGIDAEDLLQAWVKAVRDAGIDRIGTLLIDDRVFDREVVHPGWPRDQLYKHYCAGVSGVNFHANVLHFFPAPIPGGRAEPGPSTPAASWITVSSKASSNRNGTDGAWVVRNPDDDALELMGNVRVRFGIPLPVTVREPSQFFVRLLKDRLEAAGVEVGDARVATADDPVSQGQQIGPVITTRLETVLERCNTDSFNLAAEALLKRSSVARGQVPGSFAGGSAVVRSVIAERLRDQAVQSRLRISDGSGLARDNHVPPSLITAWLRSFDTDPELGPLFRASLATPGTSGTLRRRLSGMPDGIDLMAKTGYIDRVSCLSGYVRSPHGTLCFSVMVNGFPRSAGKAKETQDAIVRLLADGLADAVRRRAAG